MEVDARCFPLKDIISVVEVFKQELDKFEPSLAKLSIILGFYETALTCKGADPSTCPSLDQETFGALYSKYLALIRKDFQFNEQKNPATREIVTSIADLVWSCLAKSYFKDRPHIQNLYSFLTGNRLDCFGVAYTVVAICQTLGYNDVHLALSEDHAWVIFGPGGRETAEVTWHGKGNEDKRGRPVDYNADSIHSWLYVGGYPVRCTRHMEIASAVSSINPAINSTTDSMELAKLQQNLLWVLYDKGHIQRYPMALGNIADLEEVSPSPGRPTPEAIFNEAIKLNKELYNGQHVYPYTYLAGFFHRQKNYLRAMQGWVQAAYVAGKYNYSKEDEEMFKEFYEIANVFIPNILKQSSSSTMEVKVYSPSEDPEFFAYLLQFYDGICLWEEGSHTPVLHADWAKKLVQSISKISPTCRAALSVPTPKPGPKPLAPKPLAPKPLAPKPLAPKPLAPIPQAPPTITDKKPETSHQATENVQRNNSTGNSEQELGSSHQAPAEGETNNTAVKAKSNPANDKEPVGNKRVVVLALKSTKMREMRSLLTNGGKLNTSAIKLQLTAQSQVSVPKNRRRSSFKADDYVYDFDEEAEKEDDDDGDVEEEEGEEEQEEEEWEEEEEGYPWAKRPRQGMYPMF